MGASLLIARRELAGYLRTMSGWVIIAGVLAITALLFNAFVMGGASKRSAEVISQFFYVCSGMVMIASILLSMRLLAEERQTGTLALLYSSPIRDVEIVLGKFLSGLVFLGLMLALTTFMPLLVMVNGKVSFGHLAAGYLGLMLLGSAALAVGTFGSALAKNQVVAAIIGGCLLVALIITWWLSRVTDRPFNDIYMSLGFWGKHFPPFMAGVIHLRGVVYYLLVTFVMLFAATRVLEARRWR